MLDRGAKSTGVGRYNHQLTKKTIGACPTSWRQNSWPRYGM